MRYEIIKDHSKRFKELMIIHAGECNRAYYYRFLVRRGYDRAEAKKIAQSI